MSTPVGKRGDPEYIEQPDASKKSRMSQPRAAKTQGVASKSIPSRESEAPQEDRLKRGLHHKAKGQKADKTTAIVEGRLQQSGAASASRRQTPGVKREREEAAVVLEAGQKKGRVKSVRESKATRLQKATQKRAEEEIKRARVEEDVHQSLEEKGIKKVKAASVPRLKRVQSAERILTHETTKKERVEREPALDTAEFGEKHIHNVNLHYFFQDLGIEGVEVPLPFGLRSSAIHAFLQNHVPEVFQRWEELAQLYHKRPEGEDGKRFLDRQDVSQLLQVIRQNVRDSLKGASLQEVIPRKERAECAAFLEDIAKKGSYLMVRSSGDEDSSYANAGGNISEHYIAPNEGDIMQAVGNVVASYFSTPSLANRLNARVNPFASDLMLSVSLQELVGETPGSIPASIVLFSNEPAYGGSDRFRIMCVSCTHGHGEAVVGNAGVATDSYYLLQSRVDPDDLYIVSDIKEKKERLAPVLGPDGKMRLEIQKNPAELIQAPTLSKDMLLRLFTVATLVEESHAGAFRDMELVVKDGIIYPVQERSINRPIPFPSYLDPAKVLKLPQNPITKKLQGSCLVPGTSDAVIVYNPDEILYDTTLKRCEERFQQGQHKVVIVKEPEPRESHYVVNFSDLGIPCLQIGALDQVEEAVHAAVGSQCLVVDVQDASLQLWDNNIASPESNISQGYLHHPAHVSVSVDTENLPHMPAGDMRPYRDLQEIIHQIKTAATSQLAHEKIKELSCHPVFQRLRDEKDRLEPAVDQIQTLRGRCAVRAASTLDQRITRAFQEAISETQEPLERLFHIKVIEQLLFQPPALDGSLGKLSVVSVAKLLQEAEEIVQYAKMVGRKARFADLVFDAQHAPLDKTKELWLQTLKTLEKAPPRLQPRIDMLLQLLDLLRSSNRLGTWITLTLKEPVSNDPVQILNDLLAGIDSNTLQEMQYLQHDIATIRSMHQDLNNFSDPKKIQASWGRLEAYAMALKEDDRLERIQALFVNNSLPATLLAQATLNELVDLYDKAIKSMKASRAYSETEKIAHFHTMVGSYLDLFTTWAGSLLISDQRDYDYLKLLRGALQNTHLTADTLRPSRNFEVGPALMSAETTFSRHLPQTLEDIFTLTHQNLLSISSKLIERVVPVDSLLMKPLPEVMRGALQKVSQSKNDRGIALRSNLLGVDIDQTTISLSFNRPLENHSASFELVYDAKAGGLSLQVHLYGQARDRWNVIQERLLALNTAKLIQLREKPAVTMNSLACVLDLDLEQIENAFAVFESVVSFASHEGFSDSFPSTKAIFQPVIKDLLTANKSIIELFQEGYPLETTIESSKELGRDDLVDNFVEDFIATEQGRGSRRAFSDVERLAAFKTVVPLLIKKGHLELVKQLMSIPGIDQRWSSEAIVRIGENLLKEGFVKEVETIAATCDLTGFYRRDLCIILRQTVANTEILLQTINKKLDDGKSIMSVNEEGYPLDLIVFCVDCSQRSDAEKLELKKQYVTSFVYALKKDSKYLYRDRIDQLELFGFVINQGGDVGEGGLWAFSKILEHYIVRAYGSDRASIVVEEVAPLLIDEKFFNSGFWGEGAKSINDQTVVSLSHLFVYRAQVLLMQGQDYEGAVDAAEGACSMLARRGLVGAYPGFMQLLLRVRNDLMKGKAVAELQQALKSTDSPENLWKELFSHLEKDEFLEKAKVLFNSCLKGGDVSLLRLALMILSISKLPEEERIKFELIGEACIESKEKEKQIFALDILEWNVIGGGNYQGVEEICASFLGSSEWEVREKALSVYRTLVSKGQCLQEAKLAKEMCLKDSNVDVWSQAYALEKLLAKMQP